MRQRQSFAIILVGKSILLREGLARILRSANFRILASVSSADDLLPGKPQLHQPLFLVIHTGDECDAALEQIKLFRNQHPGGRIAIVADHYRLSELVAAFRAGANGYFADVMACDVFIKSVELVMMGETIFPPAFLSLILDPNGDRLDQARPRDEKSHAILIGTENTLAPQLSTRKKLILRGLIEGDSNKSIARKIDIAEATVKVHEGDPSQDQSQEPNTGGDLGDEHRLCDTVGKQKLSAPFAGPEQVLRYLSRYTHRVAISNRRLVAADDGAIAFRWKDYRVSGPDRWKTMRLHPHEFIRRFLMHVLPKGFHRIRHYGLFANANRAENIATVRALLNVAPPAADPQEQPDIATDTPHVLPCPCPRCGGRMIVIEVFARGCEPTWRPMPNRIDTS